MKRDKNKTARKADKEQEDPRLLDLQARIAEIQSRPKTSGDMVAFRRNFGDMLAVLEELRELHEDEEGKDRLTGILEVLHGLDDAVSGDPERAVAGKKKITDSKQLQLFFLGQMLSKAAENPKVIAGMREHLLTLDGPAKAELLYVHGLALTEDAFGIVLRGHVLIENALQACIYSYVPRPVNLYKKLERFFAQKVRLAHMLGVIDDQDRSLLKAFNELRNKVAHQGAEPGQSGPDFHLTAKHEEELWKKFIATPSMKGDWPSYDATKFPKHLKYAVMAIYMTLFARATDLKAKRLEPVVATLEVEPPHKRSLPHITVFLANLLVAVGDVDEAEVGKPEAVTESSGTD